MGENPFGIFFVNIEPLKFHWRNVVESELHIKSKRSKLFSAAVHLYPQIMN